MRTLWLFPDGTVRTAEVPEINRKAGEGDLDFGKRTILPLLPAGAVLVQDPNNVFNTVDNMFLTVTAAGNLAVDTAKQSWYNNVNAIRSAGGTIIS